MYRIKLTTYYQVPTIVEGVKKEKGMIHLIKTSGLHYKTIDEAKQSAKIDWMSDSNIGKAKRLEIFHLDQLVYVFDSQLGEWGKESEAENVL